MLKKTLISALFLFSPVTAFANEYFTQNGPWVCEDRHPYWEGKNMHLSFFQILMEGGKGVRIYSMTFYNEGVDLKYVVEHDWSATENAFTIENFRTHFSNMTSKRLLNHDEFVPMNGEMRDKMIEVINGILPAPTTPIPNDIRRSGEIIYLGEDDRFECLKATSM